MGVGFGIFLKGYSDVFFWLIDKNLESNYNIRC